MVCTKVGYEVRLVTAVVLGKELLDGLHASHGVLSVWAPAGEA